MRSARLPGRTQWIDPKPAAATPSLKHVPVLLDGAHNPAGVEALCTHLLESKMKEKKGARARVFFSVMRDKEYLSVYRALRTVTDDVVFLDMSALFPRALPFSELRDELNIQYGEEAPVRAVPLTWEGIEPLLQSGADSAADYAVFCGSLFLLGEVIPLLLPHYNGLEEFEELVGEKNH